MGSSCPSRTSQLLRLPSVSACTYSQTVPLILKALMHSTFLVRLVPSPSVVSSQDPPCMASRPPGTAERGLGRRSSIVLQQTSARSR